MKLTPIAGYVGSKKRFADTIVQYFPRGYSTYYEPFVGMGSVFLKLQPANAIISDIDSDVINIWKQIKNNPQGLIGEMLGIPIANKETFDRIKMNLQSIPFNSKRAACYIFLLKYSFGSVIRYDRENKIQCYFRKAYENKPNIMIKKKYFTNLINISSYLNKNDIKIFNQSFEKTIADAVPTDLIYMDSPYVTKRKDFYKHNEYTLPIDHFLILKKRNVQVYMSNTTQAIDRIGDYAVNVKSYVNETTLNSKTTRKKLTEVLLY